MVWTGYCGRWAQLGNLSEVVDRGFLWVDT